MEPRVVPNVTCPHCRTERPHTAEWWPISKGELRKDTCIPCNRARQKKWAEERKKQAAVQAQRSAVAEAAGVPNPRAVAPADPAPKLPAVRPRKVSVGTALQATAHYINHHAETILARVVLYANDPTSVHHEWALRMLMERVAPLRAITAIAERDGDVGQDAKPQQPPVTIVIQGTPRITATVAKPAIEHDAVPVDGEAVPVDSDAVPAEFEELL